MAWQMTQLLLLALAAAAWGAQVPRTPRARTDLLNVCTWGRERDSMELLNPQAASPKGWSLPYTRSFSSTLKLAFLTA